MCATALAVVTIAMITVVANTTPSSVQAQHQGGRLITVHDRGVDTAFITDKPTLKEALADQGIALDEKDAVEPALDEKLVAPDYQVNIYRARPVTIIDGALRQKIVTPYQSAERIVRDAGVALYAEDITTVSRSADIVGDGAGLQLTITRATPITVDLYGKLTTVRTQAKTVKDFLREKHISLEHNDRISAADATPITSQLSLRIWREGKQTLTVDESVAFDTERIKDADRELDYRAVQTEGKDGRRTVTYEITIENGIEVGRTEIASVEIEAPVTRVEVIGAKLPTPTTPTESQAIGHDMMLAAGFGDDQWPCLYNLWMRESGWRTTAGNPTSGAYGIPQSLPASKMATFGADYATNPRTQIAWGLSYIKGRYGTPCGAWNAFNSRSPHWY